LKQQLHELIEEKHNSQHTCVLSENSSFSNGSGVLFLATRAASVRSVACSFDESMDRLNASPKSEEKCDPFVRRRAPKPKISFHKACEIRASPAVLSSNMLT
jgi:hypothetical protein